MTHAGRAEIVLLGRDPPHRAREGDLVSTLAQTVDPPARSLTLEHDALLELATADDLDVGMANVAAKIRLACGAARVEWWAGGDDVLELVAEAGDGSGRPQKLLLGRAGVIVVFGGLLDPELASTLTTLAPIVRRRRSEERLARQTVELARRNEALEDFAALVAHELKAPLCAALLADDASSSIEQALSLVEALLEAARTDGGPDTFASAAECFELAVRDLGETNVVFTAELATTLPLPGRSLRIVLRNLLANAVAAGARHVHVTSVQSPRATRLFVDDDGVGLAAADRYSGGSGLGLSLCRRIAARFGGTLELTPRVYGGTRATFLLQEATQ
jgi:signal transduction histidine kinase